MATVNFVNFTPPEPRGAGEVDAPKDSANFTNFIPPAPFASGETDAPIPTGNFVNFTPPAEPLPTGAGPPNGRDRLRCDLLGSASPYAIATSQFGRAYLEVCEELAAPSACHGAKGRVSGSAGG